MDGVVRLPASLAITSTFEFKTAATQEKVVPRSMPIGTEDDMVLELLEKTNMHPCRSVTEHILQRSPEQKCDEQNDKPRDEARRCNGCSPLPHSPCRLVL